VPDQLHELVAAGAIVMLMAMWVVVRRMRYVRQRSATLVLPHIDVAAPRRRLARGSVAFPSVDPIDVSAALASRRTLRPSHARRSA
jgi:hypothetical protein